MFTPIPLYCDLDQVLYDWIGYTTSKYAKGLTQEQLNKHPNRVGILTEMYIQEPDFFRNLPLCEGAKELYQGLRNLHRSGLISLSFLTATDTIHFNAFRVREDKLYALQRDFGVMSHEVTVVLHSVEKAKYAQPGVILLDDYEKNISEWRAAGGTGVFVPENYSAKDVLAELEATILAMRKNTVAVDLDRRLETMDKLTAYGKEIRKLRVELELNLKEMAELVGVSSSYLSAQELGRKDVSAGWCRRVADALGLSEAQYLTLVAAAATQRRTVVMDTTVLPSKHATVLTRLEEMYRDFTEHQWAALEAVVASQ